MYNPSEKYVSIRCVTLKEVFDSNNIRFCDVLKIDCEGAEYDLLSHTPQYYFSKIDKIVLEYHDYLQKIKKGYHLSKFLNRKGFTIKMNKHPLFNQGIIYAQNTNRNGSLLIQLKNYVTLLVNAFEIEIRNKILRPGEE